MCFVSLCTNTVYNACMLKQRQLYHCLKTLLFILGYFKLKVSEIAKINQLYKEKQ